MAQWTNKHPFLTVAALASPVLALVARNITQRAQHSTSVKLMHFRVVGQASVLVLLLVGMAATGNFNYTYA